MSLKSVDEYKKQEVEGMNSLYLLLLRIKYPNKTPNLLKCVYFLDFIMDLVKFTS